MDAPGGALGVPRAFQGQGRHDAPDRYGAMYLSERPVSGVAEQLARFRGRALRAQMLRLRGLPFALCAYRLDAAAALIDLDAPAVLAAEGLAPSRVATRQRARTQADARALHDRHPDAAGLRWWSVLEAGWINWTLFDTRLAGRLVVGEERPEPLALGHPVVIEAAEALGMA